MLVCDIQLFHPLSALLVAGTSWSHDSHMLLLRCISDSIDFEGVLALLDLSESSQLTLPLGRSSILLSANSVESAFSLIYSVPCPPGYARTNLCPQAKQGHGKGNSE